MSHPENLLSLKIAVEEKYGPWTAHNFSLGNGIFTMKAEVTGDEVKLRRVLQTVSDISDQPISGMKILDLACLEGMYAIAFAKKGATVCAIEGREANIEKARFAANTLSLANIEFHQDDVRNLSKEKYGSFDVVLCLGILYHLNHPDLFTFLKQIFSVCRHFAVIDTHISRTPDESIQYQGVAYWGQTVVEHPIHATDEEKLCKAWSSLDNPTSFYLTRGSLLRLTSQTGFTSAYECHLPEEPDKPDDRITLLAVKGNPEQMDLCPQLTPNDTGKFPETFLEEHLIETPSVRPRWYVLSRLLPGKFKDRLKKTLFSD